MKSRIIKKHLLKPGAPGAASSELPHRIPGRRVRPVERGSPSAEPPGGILPRSRSQAAAPAALSEEEWAADFPVEGSATGRPSPKQTERLRAEWEAAWVERMDAERAAARKAAYAEGYEAARREAAAEAEAERAALLGDLDRLERLVQGFLTRCEPQLLDLAFEIAQAVLAAPLPPEVRSIAERALSEAVEHLTGEASLEVSLHPVDFLRLQESGLVEGLGALHPELRWEPNPRLKQGEWTASSPSAIVRRLEQELLATLRARLTQLSPEDGKQ